MNTKPPFYLFKKNKISENFNYINSVFSSKLENFTIAYSFKTNSCPQVLSLVKNLGAKAEVVSPFEYQLAKNAGFEIKDIIYNGVMKTKETFLECALNGGKVNIDNEEELNLALEHFEKNKKILDLGLRLNFDIGNHIKSRFGINVDSELFERIKILNIEEKIKIKGLHCHFTEAKDLKFWQNRMRLLDLRKFFPEVEYFDFGGNMFPTCEKNLMAEYAGLIQKSLSERKIDSKKYGIIIEAGTPIVQNAFDVVSHITHIKEGFIFLDVSLKDVGLSAISDECKIQINRNPEIKERNHLENCMLVGSTCLENDILKKSFSGKVAIGDEIVFRNCGAYSLAWANDFIMQKLEILEK